MQSSVADACHRRKAQTAAADARSAEGEGEVKYDVVSARSAVYLSKLTARCSLNAVEAEAVAKSMKLNAEVEHSLRLGVAEDKAGTSR